MIDIGPAFRALYWAIGAGLVICVLVGIAVGVWAVPLVFHRPTPPDPVEQYYRGTLDMCRVMARMNTLPEKSCEQKVLPKIIEKKWYEQSTTDWTWPLSATPVKQ